MLRVEKCEVKVIVMVEAGTTQCERTRRKLNKTIVICQSSGHCAALSRVAFWVEQRLESRTMSRQAELMSEQRRAA